MEGPFFHFHDYGRKGIFSPWFSPTDSTSVDDQILLDDLSVDSSHTIHLKTARLGKVGKAWISKKNTDMFFETQKYLYCRLIIYTWNIYIYEIYLCVNLSELASSFSNPLIKIFEYYYIDDKVFLTGQVLVSWKVDGIHSPVISWTSDPPKIPIDFVQKLLMICSSVYVFFLFVLGLIAIFQHFMGWFKRNFLDISYGSLNCLTIPCFFKSAENLRKFTVFYYCFAIIAGSLPAPTSLVGTHDGQIAHADLLHIAFFKNTPQPKNRGG